MALHKRTGSNSNNQISKVKLIDVVFADVSFSKTITHTQATCVFTSKFNKLERDWSQILCLWQNI